MNRLALLLTLFFAAGAYAGEKAGATFDKLDKNQDGQVSAQEASEHSKLNEMWTEVDRDASGTIDQSEFSAYEAMTKPGEAAE